MPELALTTQSTAAVGPSGPHRVRLPLCRPVSCSLNREPIRISAVTASQARVTP
jgi:hypothetical protein